MSTALIVAISVISLDALIVAFVLGMIYGKRVRKAAMTAVADVSQAVVKAVGTGA